MHTLFLLHTRSGVSGCELMRLCDPWLWRFFAREGVPQVITNCYRQWHTFLCSRLLPMDRARVWWLKLLRTAVPMLDSQNYSALNVIVNFLRQYGNAVHTTTKKITFFYESWHTRLYAFFGTDSLPLPFPVTLDDDATLPMVEQTPRRSGRVRKAPLRYQEELYMYYIHLFLFHLFSFLHVCMFYRVISY